MKRLVFFWVEKFQEIDFMNHEGKFLFEDFGVDLSSKYHFEYKWDSDNRELYDLKVSVNTELIKYSDKIHDLKVLVGNNGVGKTSLLKLISGIVSGNKLNKTKRYVVFWEENEKIFYYAKECVVRGSYNQMDCLPFFTTIFYSSDFSRYQDESVEIDSFINVRTNYLMRYIHNKQNDSISQYCLDEETCMIDFLIVFSKMKNAEGNSLLREIINIPPRLIFTFMDDAVEVKIDQLVANGRIKGHFLDRESIRIIEKSRENFFDKLLFVAWLGLCEKNDNEEIDESKEIVENFDLYMRKKHPEVVESIMELSKTAHLGEVSFYEGGPKLFVAMYNLENEFDEVRSFRDRIRSVNPYFLFMPITIDYPLSAGEYEYMQFFSRFWNVIKKNHNQMDNSDFLLILDEVDRGLHPEWQRIWFTRFLESLDAISDTYGIKINMQLFMATHSPFMLSDFADESILKLKRVQEKSGFLSNVKCDYSPTKCFGGNIYDIMKDGFFLESSIGGFVENEITKMIEDVKKCKEENCPLSKDYSFVNRIGNPILKSLLLQKIKSVVGKK